MTAARVSVVIPVFGRQRQLDHALLSLASEAEHIHDVTVVDDASPQPIVVNVPTSLVGRTRLVRLDSNVGSSAARQVGVDHGTGELVAFLDSDDVWLPGKIAAQLAIHAQGGELVAVATGWQVVDAERGRTWCRTPVASDQPVDFASGCWFCPGSTVLLSRKAFDLVGPFDPALRRLEDLDWFLRFALAGGRLAVADCAGALIRHSHGRDRAALDAAAARIAANFAGVGALRGNLIAWLDVERALAAHATGDTPAALLLLLRSLARKPRARIQLQRWWQTGAPMLPMEEARRRLGLSLGQIYTR